MENAPRIESLEVQLAHLAVKQAARIKREAIERAVNQAQKIAVDRDVVGESIILRHGRKGRPAKRPPANFAVPAKRKRELRSSTSLRTFHLALNAVSKTSAARGSANGRSYTGAASTHIAYIEDGAITRSGHTVYIDSSRVEKGAGGERLVRSNISGDYDERVEFFRLVEVCERNNRGDSLSVCFEVNPDAWVRVVNDPTCDPAVREAFADWASQPNEDGRYRIALTASPSELRRVMKRHGFPFTPAKNKDRLAADGFSFHDGRGGRTESRVVLELPREFTPEQRIEALERISAYVGELGCMYVGVIHAPDPHNDKDNYHIHLDFYDRPCRRLDGSDDDLRNVGDLWKSDVAKEMREGKFRDAIGQWDFAVERRYPSNKRYKTHRPFGAKKVEAVRSISFARKLRSRFAEIVNEASRSKNGKDLYDPRTYAEMGIASPPSEKLYPARHGLEIKGVPTALGIANEVAQADFDRAQIEKAFADDGRKLDEFQFEWQRSVKSEDKELVALSKSVNDEISRARTLLEIERDLRLFELESARQRSRAEMVIERQTSIMKSKNGAAAQRAAALVDEGKAFIEVMEEADASLGDDLRVLRAVTQSRPLAGVERAVATYQAEASRMATKASAHDVQSPSERLPSRRNMVRKRSMQSGSVATLPSISRDVGPLNKEPSTSLNVAAVALKNRHDQPADDNSGGGDPSDRADPRHLAAQLREAAGSHLAGHRQMASRVPVEGKGEISAHRGEAIAGSPTGNGVPEPKPANPHSQRQAVAAPVMRSPAAVSSEGPDGAPIFLATNGDAPNEEIAWERKHLLDTIRAERIDVTFDGGKVSIREHPDLSPRFLRHADYLTFELREISRTVNAELDLFRRHLASGKADYPFMRCLRTIRPDIARPFEEAANRRQKEVELAAANELHKRAAIEAARRGLGF